MSIHLVWFRNDLRTTDNPALIQACCDPTAQVIALFMPTPIQWQKHGLSARQLNFKYQNLLKLQQALASLNIPLLVRRCDDFNHQVEQLAQLCQTHQVDALFYNYQYEYDEQTRDTAVVQRLSPKVSCVGSHGGLFFPPLSIHNAQQRMYQVFTPFRRAFLHKFEATKIVPEPSPQVRFGQPILLQSIAPFTPTSQDDPRFPAGETSALAQLAAFCTMQVADYAKTRDFPSLDSTSKLSAYLACGVLSVRQCLAYLISEFPLFWQHADSGAFSWFNELIWREFYHHLLIAYPNLSRNQTFIPWTAQIAWLNDPVGFAQWQAGLTGYPIVDAAMRQLQQTGWMHNRLRMISASFLVKDLLIDWRLGERYFMSQLIDGDLAANNGGWQWAASTGTDSVPYFRIFNPTTQGQRFDPRGQFIRQWLPELESVPDKYIHTPHQWSEGSSKIVSYPLPIVDHTQARSRALTAFNLAKADHVRL